ncbi:MAG: glycogen/starch synthase [Bacteroidales bacterium]|nr:glycogen/starch synthase [Bacteroidales bacterium]
MEGEVKKVLFVNSEIFPYLPETQISKIGRFLPQGTLELKREVRSFMPRFGLINERKNSLHEVIRLSGMNIIIGDVDRPLVIKVTSISAARMQVYFIDNDDYFRRKALFHDDKGNFFKDNEDRAIFFARGVLETVKKLRWEPDIIHCQGWIGHILPLYLRKEYKDDPIFARSKVIVSLYNDIPGEQFAPDFAKRIKFGSITNEDVSLLARKASGISLAKLAVRYSDGIIMGSNDVPAEEIAFCNKEGKPVLPFNAASLEDGSYIKQYNDFYDQVFAK